jgi:hypothetical protein
MYFNLGALLSLWLNEYQQISFPIRLDTRAQGGARMEQTENTAKLCHIYSVHFIYHAAIF